MGRNAKAFERVEKATVKIPETHGRGVLVAGGYVLTAAHCVQWNPMMIEQDHILQTVVSGRRKVRLGLAAAEPVADIAALSIADNQTFHRDHDQFERICASIKPVPLARDHEETFRAHVWTHERRWVYATASIVGPHESALSIMFHEPIKGGTSGSPIVNDAGKLVAVVSNSSEGTATPWGCQPRPQANLPVWLVAAIKDAEDHPE
jgi:hypothetical protein